MGDRPKIEAGLFDHLIDAEREALARSGRKVGKIDLIKALRAATGLGLREARRAVEGYLGRRGGSIPSGAAAGQPLGWIDNLLDAERAAASKEDRPVNKILLIKALQGASGLGLREARLSVEDYLRRRGGEGLPSGSNGWLLGFVAIVAIVLIVVALVVTIPIH
jgi:hypothetical protein